MLNNVLGLDLSLEAIFSLAGLGTSYLASQGAVDWKKAGEPGKERGEG